MSWSDCRKCRKCANTLVLRLCVVVLSICYTVESTFFFFFLLFFQIAASFGWLALCQSIVEKKGWLMMKCTTSAAHAGLVHNAAMAALMAKFS